MSTVKKKSLASRPAPVSRKLGVPIWKWCLLGLATVAAGCSTPMDARQDAAYHELAPTAALPVVRPVRSISSFSESLDCMDEMLREAQVPTTLIAAKQFPDYTGKVPVSIKEMAITALSQMSRLSNAFRYVDYEVNIAIQDTVQNLTTILLNNNQMQLQRPALYLSGGVSFFDQNVISNNWTAGTSANRLDTGYSQNRNATVIGLEMQLGDFRTRTLIPGMDSANEVIIGAGGQGLDLAGRIGSYGVKFNVGRDYALSTGGAVRTLVDLAVIELVGKWAHVPYWQCLMLDQTHPSFQRQMRDWYDESGPSGQLKLIEASLEGKGYLSAKDAELPATAPAVRDALARFQADQGIVVTGVTDFQTYERALRGFVALKDDGSLARVGWTRDGPQTVTVADGGKAPAIGITSPVPWLIDMQIENPQPASERPAFTQGEQIFLSATVSRASYLYCYFVDAAGEATRMLPNALQPNALVSANQAVRMPDWMSPNSGYSLDAGKPGTEAAVCVASRDDPAAKLPPDLQVPALTSIKGVHGVDGLLQQFDAVLGGEDSHVSQVLRWQVVQRPPQAPARPQQPPAKR